MHHQDWTPIVLRNKSNTVSNKNATTEVQKKQQHDSKPKDIDGAQQLVTNDLKQKIILARTSLNLKQDQLAKAINVLPKNIQLCDSGKLSLKEAKQIAIKIEQKYKVHILKRN